MAEQRGKASPKGAGEIGAKGQVFYGWDTYSLVVLSIFLTGLVPLAIGTGIGVGFAVSEFLTRREAGVVGLISCLAMGVLYYLLLRGFTSARGRQWFIPFARRLFPSSEEVAKRSRS